MEKNYSSGKEMIFWEVQKKNTKTWLLLSHLSRKKMIFRLKVPKKNLAFAVAFSIDIYRGVNCISEKIHPCKYMKYRIKKLC